MKLLLTCLISLLFAAPSWAGTQFFQTLPEIPAPPHVQILPEQAVMYDNESGRVVEVTALLTEKMSNQDVVRYYQTALPAFGWLKQSDTSYHREHEILTIRFESHAAQRYVMITVAPR